MGPKVFTYFVGRAMFWARRRRRAHVRLPKKGQPKARGPEAVIQTTFRKIDVHLILERAGRGEGPPHSLHRIPSRIFTTNPPQLKLCNAFSLTIFVVSSRCRQISTLAARIMPGILTIWSLHRWSAEIPVASYVQFDRKISGANVRRPAISHTPGSSRDCPRLRRDFATCNLTQGNSDLLDRCGPDCDMKVKNF